jgi:hypothetical protein
MQLEAVAGRADLTDSVERAVWRRGGEGLSKTTVGRRQQAED